MPEVCECLDCCGSDSSTLRSQVASSISSALRIRASCSQRFHGVNFHENPHDSPGRSHVLTSDCPISYQSCLVIVTFGVCGTVRAALQFLVPKAFGTGFVPLLEWALALPEACLVWCFLMGLRSCNSPVGVLFQGVLGSGCGFLTNVDERRLGD